MARLAVLHHRRQERFAAVDDTPQVDVDRPVPEGKVVVHRNGPAGADSGVVAQEVHVAEAIAGERFQLPYLIALSHIEDERVHGVARSLEFAASLGQRFGLHIGQHELHSGGAKRASDLSTDAAGSPGDDGGSTLKFQHVVLSIGFSSGHSAHVWG